MTKVIASDINGLYFYIRFDRILNFDLELDFNPALFFMYLNLKNMIGIGIKAFRSLIAMFTCVKFLLFNTLDNMATAIYKGKRCDRNKFYRSGRSSQFIDKHCNVDKVFKRK